MPKTLLLDIETAPNRAFVWGLFDQNISPDQLEESGYILCWSAKWLGAKARFAADRQHSTAKVMLKPMHALLGEADAVIHYNGRKFDIPVLNKEFVKLGLDQPSPYKQIDLMHVVKQKFRFESNKLDYVCQQLGLGSKVRHPGFKMWVGCMENDPAAWKKMIRYNHGDVALLERLYTRLLPWIQNHPNVAGGAGVCPKCGSARIQKRGMATAITRVYVRYQCQDCSSWFRGTATVSKTGATMTNIGT